MRTANCGVALVLALVAAMTVVADDSSGQQPLTAGRIDALVRQLGAASFATRESATRELTVIGMPAHAALLEAIADDDAEVRMRARRVLETVLERDFQVRLREFAADRDVHAGHGLGSWDRFAGLIGDDPAARRLFVEMQRAEAGLLELADGDPPRAAEMLDARMRQFQDGDFNDEAFTWQGASVGRIAALLFVAAQGEAPLSEETASFVANFIYQNSFQQAIAAGPAADPLRKILGGWIARPFTPGSPMRVQNLMIAMQYDLPAGLDLALVMLRDQPAEPYPRAYTVLAVAKFGRREHLPSLAPLLADASSCGEFEFDQRKIDCQVRDVALAAMVRLSGQQLSDYGFDLAQPDEFSLLDVSRLGFADDARRDAALAKWRAWQSSNAPGPPAG
jgi:hypothetical protein